MNGSEPMPGKGDGEPGDALGHRLAVGLSVWLGMVALLVASVGLRAWGSGRELLPEYETWASGRVDAGTIGGRLQVAGLGGVMTNDGVLVRWCPPGSDAFVPVFKVYGSRDLLPWLVHLVVHGDELVVGYENEAWVLSKRLMSLASSTGPVVVARGERVQ